MTDIPFTTYAYPTTGTPASRTTPARFAEIYNVKDFGALGDFSGALLSTRYGSLAAAVADYPLVPSLALTDTIDYAAIQSAINTMWASASKGGTVFISEGGYNVGGKGIEIGSHEIGSSNTCGRIVGTSRSSFVFGNITNGFVMRQTAGLNGPEEISNLAIANISSWIGSGGLMLNNSTATLNNLRMGGMMACFFPWNIFNASLNGCTGGCPADPDISGHTGTGYNGTLGFAGFTPTIRGWRSTSPMLAAIQVSGSNSASIDSCGIENCVTAILLGTFTGWASHCTVAPDAGNPGFSILTIASDAQLGGGSGPGVADGDGEIYYGMTVFGRGLSLPAWGSDPNDTTGGTTITSVGPGGGLTGTGWQGTYQINGTYTITTPIPIWTRKPGICAGITVNAIQSEANFHTIYLNSVAGCHISGVGCGSNPVECSNGFASGTGLTPRAPIYLKSASATTISGCSVGGVAATTLGGIYIDPSANLQSVIFENCMSRKGEDNITTGSIAGNIMIITTFTSGASLGVGMGVTGSGVTPGTVITSSLATAPLTETVTVSIPGGVITRTAHGLVANAPIMLYNSGNGGEHLPTGLSSRTIYYVKSVVDANNFTVSATSGGTAIATSGTQLGTHYLDRLNGSTGLSGYSGTGTWRVNNSQTVASIASGTTLTVVTAPDWVMPTATEPKTSLKFVNCSSINPTGVVSGLNNFNMLFTSLPQEAGAKGGYSRVEGQEYNIIDGAKSGGGTAAIGDATQGGGSQHIKVWWNGTSWIRFG